MSSEIEVPETPNWLRALEEKREKRLKAKLGHEAGAGAPCLKCVDKCPGLDLHFWRKACKICRCPKEEHDVHDDDVYGWAQFQLLGSKPNKIKTKIVLPGRKDEVELEWAPKGHKDTIDKYLQTLPPEALPVKGSQAAQDRKQMLQKQLPIHDIDPTLCHELNEDELKKMNEYIAHVKQSSVGVGQIVNLSSIIKGNLHHIAPQEAAIIATRYPKGIPLSEIVKLQCNIAKTLEKQLNISDPSSKNERNLTSQEPGIPQEYSVNPLPSIKIKDAKYPSCVSETTNAKLSQSQYAKGFSKLLHSGENLENILDKQPGYELDAKILQGTNFDPSKTPSQFLPKNSNQIRNQAPDDHSLPYNTISDTSKSLYAQGNSNSNVSKSFSDKLKRFDGNFSPRNNQSNKNLPPNQNYQQNAQYGYDNPLFKNTPHNLNYSRTCEESNNQDSAGTGLLKSNPRALPNYAANKYNIPADTQQPKAPKSIKDLAFSTYNPSDNGNQDHLYNLTNDKDRKPEPYDGSNSGVYDKNLQKTQMYNPQTVSSVPCEQNLGQYYPNATCENAFQYSGSNKTFEGGKFDFGVNPSEPYSALHNTDVPIMMPYKSDSNVENKGSGPDDSNIGVYDEKLKQAQLYDPKNVSSVPYDQNLGQYYPNSVGEKPFGHPNSKKTFEGGKFSFAPIQTEPYGSTNSLQNTTVPSAMSYGSNNDVTVPYYNQSEPTKRDSAGNMDPEQFGRNNGSNNYATVPYYNQSEPRKHGSAGNMHPEQFGPNSTTNLGGYGPLNTYTQETNSSVPYCGQNLDPSNPGNLSNVQYGQNFDPNLGHLQTTAIGAKGANSSAKGTLSHPGCQNYEPFDNTKKPLAQYQPGNINIPEDYLHPSQVNIGGIKDISYPEIRAATQGTNDFFEDYSPESIREILNNIKLPDCHYCKKPFEENEFAVTIDRANVLFHAQCFKCAGCNQSLADNVYFYHKESDNVYCGRDYAKIRGIPRCKACDELIFTKEYCLAENSTFHLKHFCCIECDTPLAGQDYTLEDEMPYCLPCFENSKASKCSSCSRIIKPDEIGCTLNGVHFHAVDECFACQVCKQPLMGKKMLLRNDKLYCSHDCFNSNK